MTCKLKIFWKQCQYTCANGSIIIGVDEVIEIISCCNDDTTQILLKLEIVN